MQKIYVVITDGFYYDIVIFVTRWLDTMAWLSARILVLSVDRDLLLIMDLIPDFQYQSQNQKQPIQWGTVCKYFSKEWMLFRTIYEI